MTTLSVFDVRWQCRRCGRFLKESAIRSWDVLDNGEYYGVRGVIVADCPKCGETNDPACVQTREVFFEYECPGHDRCGGCPDCRSDRELHPELYQ